MTYNAQSIINPPGILVFTKKHLNFTLFSQADSFAPYLRQNGNP